MFLYTVSGKKKIEHVKIIIIKNVVKGGTYSKLQIQMRMTEVKKLKVTLVFSFH